MTGNLPLRFVIVTLDNHLAGAVDRAKSVLAAEIPEIRVSLHAAAEWGNNPQALQACIEDIEQADIILACMLFMDDQIEAVLPALRARRDHCDALIGCLSAGEIVKLTKLGKFTMDGEAKGPMALLKRLRGSKGSKTASSGARQVAMLKRIPKILRFIPGTAQDVRAYFLTLQYWLAGSDDNVLNLLRFLIDRYAGPAHQERLRGKLKVRMPTDYPDVGVYHPRLEGRIGLRADKLPEPSGACRGTVGLLIMRSYVLAGNSAHYDGVIAALENRGLRVIPAFASGLDARPAIEKFFMHKGEPVIDALVSLTGFSLVGGPAYNDARAAEEILATLDVPYVAAQAIEFQSLEQWDASDRGLMPIESTIMVAIPELDGSTGSMLFGGRSEKAEGATARDMRSHPERASVLAARVSKLVALRTKARAERKLAIVLFNFPPNGGGTGTAAFLSVFQSLYHTLERLAAEGYRVDLPSSVDDLRQRILGGNSAHYGTDAHVCARVAVDDHVRRERYLDEIEAQWGPAPGRHLTDGASLMVQGEAFGNVLITVQPTFGYEGDPMRLLFEKSFAPTHAFSAFYRYLREDFAADAVLHFGTHGALEFMPGKHAGMGERCWPDRLIGDLPNVYLYAANNPSEATIAKRRSAATLVSYLTPPVAAAGLYKGLAELKVSLERWRGLETDADAEREKLAPLIQSQAATLELAPTEPLWGPGDTAAIAELNTAVLELEYTLIPHGLHVVGKPHERAQRVDLLRAIAESAHGLDSTAADVEAFLDGEAPEAWSEEVRLDLARADQLLGEDHELDGLVRALDARFIRPVAGGDLIRSPDILPTGRNIHGFDPFRIPSAFAVADGAAQVRRLLDRHEEEGHALPETIAIVLWGTDNLKSEGGPLAQALALMGASPRFDSYGRLCGAVLIPLEELGRPRIDVMATLSGIFRDLLPLQTRMLAEAAYLASVADEPLEWNFVRKHTLAYQAQHGCDLETAALRVFSNADGAYGSNVNQLVDSGAWGHEDELAECYTRRKCFAYGRNGSPAQQSDLLGSLLADVDLTYQNLESVELGVTTIDHYFDSLGGIGRAVRRARGGEGVPTYIGDQTRGKGKIRTLGEQVALETRTRMLNPKWYEGMLEHGYEGVRQIEAHVTNTMGWSATTGEVAPWVYQQLTETYILDDAMRQRMAELNPKASAKVANRLIEAHERQYWTPDESMLEALRRAGDELEDRLEGIGEGVAA